VLGALMRSLKTHATSMLMVAAACGAGGCIHLRDGIAEVVARVTGAVTIDSAATSPPTAEKPCLLAVYRVRGSGMPISQSHVEYSFEEHFAGPPGQYYFTVSCSTVSGAFRSEVYEVRDMRHLRDPITLGAIRLR
jgi:hypothetical protein